MSRRFFLLIFLSLLTGCSKDQPLTVELLSGTYHLRYSHGTETLQLREDGTFSQTYVGLARPNAVTNSGKWMVDRRWGTVILSDALIFDTGRDEAENPPRKSVWSLNVIQSFGHIQLPIDPDRALMFEK